ncbi:MAG: hypothetical protein FWC77_01705 [Defluviitaleaceae bacterium]|nr:hypothetical protein [Defluviitaleaceae bacterium]
MKNYKTSVMYKGWQRGSGWSYSTDVDVDCHFFSSSKPLDELCMEDISIHGAAYDLTELVEVREVSEEPYESVQVVQYVVEVDEDGDEEGSRKELSAIWDYEEV